MTKQYKRGDKAVFYVTFLDEEGGDSPTVTDPKITITHYNGSTIVTDISLQDLIQIGTTNQYYYEWSISAGADYGTYLVTYNANIDGYDIEGDESFQITPEVEIRGGII